MIGMTGISGKLGISDIIIPRWYKSLPGPGLIWFLEKLSNKTGIF